jgi:hypothetical protein
VPFDWEFSPDILPQTPYDLYVELTIQFGLDEQTPFEKFPHCKRIQSTYSRSMTWHAEHANNGLFHWECCCFVSES